MSKVHGVPLAVMKAYQYSADTVAVAADMKAGEVFADASGLRFQVNRPTRNVSSNLMVKNSLEACVVTR